MLKISVVACGIVGLCFFAYRLSLHGLRTANMDFANAWSVAHVAPAAAEVGLYKEATQLLVMKAAIDSAPDATQREHMQALSRVPLKATAITGSPFFYTVIGVFFSYGFMVDRLLYHCLAAVLAPVSVAIMCRMMGFSSIRTIAACCLIVVAAFPTWTNHSVGNWGAFQLFFLTAFVYVYSKGKVMLASLILTLASFFKPTIGFVFLIHAVRSAKKEGERANMAVGAVLGAVIAVASSSLWLGSCDVWWSFLQSIPQTANPHVYPLSMANCSIAALLLEVSGVNFSMVLSFGAVLLAVLIACMPRVGSGRGAFDCESMETVAVGLLFGLLFSGLVWPHYLVLIAPAFVWAAYLIKGRWPWLAYVLMVVVAVPLSIPFSALFYCDVVFASVCINAMLLCLLVICVAPFFPVRPDGLWFKPKPIV